MTQHAPSADTLNAWLVEQGLEGTPQETLLDGYCARLVAMGIPLMRLHVSQSAFHPKYGGLGFEWWRNREVTSERYEFSETPASMWVESPFYQILRTGLMEHRERLSQSGPPSRFPLLNGLRAEGATDYFATGLAMEPREQSLPMNPDSPPEGLLVSWVGDRQDGFRDGDLNLHWVHVNREKGRTCRACHEVHASSNPFHIRDSVPFGRDKWELPINYEINDTGGSCAPGCHSAQIYSRESGRTSAW